MNIASYAMSDERPFGEVVNRTARLLRRLADQRLTPLGLSAGHLPVLTALIRGEALSQKALTDHAGIEQPTMAATLTRMERDGAIERRPDPDDKRSILFTLSARARAQAAAIEATIRDLNQEALESLSPSDRERLRDLLARVAQSVEDNLRRSR